MDNKGMTIIVKKVTQIIAGFIFLFGIYIVLHGHLTPGGGFAGGVIISGAFILLVLAYGTSIMKLQKEENYSTFFEALGILLFAITAVGGILLLIIIGHSIYGVSPSRIFFKNFLPLGNAGEINSAGFIPLLNIFIGIEVAAALLTMFLAFVIKSREGKI